MNYPKFAKPIRSHKRDHYYDTANMTTAITGAVAWTDTPIGLSNAVRLPALFISHGAPTLAIEQSATTSALARMGHNLPKPRAIVIMSAHWLSSTLEISSNPQPKT